MWFCEIEHQAGVHCIFEYEFSLNNDSILSSNETKIWYLLLLSIDLKSVGKIGYSNRLSESSVYITAVCVCYESACLLTWLVNIISCHCSIRSFSKLLLTLFVLDLYLAGKTQKQSHSPLIKWLMFPRPELNLCLPIPYSWKIKEEVPLSGDRTMVTASFKDPSC